MGNVKLIVLTLLALIGAQGLYEAGYWVAGLKYKPIVKEYEERIKIQERQATIAAERLRSLETQNTNLQEELNNKKATIITRYKDRIIIEEQKSCAILPETADAYNQFLQ